MIKSRTLKTLLLGAALTLLSSRAAHAATYTVTSGDSLFKVGQLFNTTYTSLMTNNHLSSSSIYPGQVLSVPAATYTVKSGDSLYLIARRNGISLYSLRKANNIWNDYVYPGQVLNIPKANTSYTDTPAVVAPKSVISYTQSEFDLLARLITAETDGQPYQAMVAVGGVVVNRVQSGEFPDNINDVIYQRINGYYQFSPVLNGWINKPASDIAKKAALEALQGNDPSNNALFYFDDSATNAWLWSKPQTARIGNMVFVK